jgi:hypothetical protein
MSYSQLSENAKHIVAKFTLATSLEVAQGVAWYSVAYDTAMNMGEKYGLSAQTCAGVIAALSPNNRWERNIIDAENIIKAWRHGDDDDVLAVKCCTYHKMKEKALKILNSAKPIDEILNGPKIVEFYHCITDRFESAASHTNDVCIDGHAYSVWFGLRLTMKQVPNIGVKLRAKIKQDYRDATSFINEELGEKYKASDIQAITWVTHKRIYNV